MKRGLIVTALGASFLVNGCATLELTREQSRTYYLTVSSTPPAADIYVNDRLVGQTPSNNVPLFIRFDVSRDPLGFLYERVDGLKESYVLRVSKSGYRDAIEPIKVGAVEVNDEKGYIQGLSYKPVQERYHFDLQKQE